jgi:hypothetical protein
MNFDWQNTLALLMVIFAGGFLARRSWLALRQRSKAGCGSCGSCSANKTANAGKPMVTLETMLKPHRPN